MCGDFRLKFSRQWKRSYVPDGGLSAAISENEVTLVVAVMESRSMGEK